MSSPVKVAVVGHVEWVEFARVTRMPRPGEIVETRELFAEPAGGGAVAAVQLARLCGGATLFTALGEDELAQRACARLQDLGVRVRAAPRAAPTRRALTLVDDVEHERTIITLGERLEPSAEDRQLPWDELAGMDAVYFTAGDLGALRAARQARVLVASPRAWHALGHGVSLDALVLSGEDASEQADAQGVRQDATLLVRTEGERGGTWLQGDRPQGEWRAAEPPGALVDTYGCGDSFAAGFTCGLACALDVPVALELAARCGAVCLTGSGPYRRQLTAAELGA
ncbi:MAG TPA: PfkB family carbohydrate kinase [Solirubrobacteraceae bacterium]|jgi:ribokinase